MDPMGYTVSYAYEWVIFWLTMVSCGLLWLVVVNMDVKMDVTRSFSISVNIYDPNRSE